MSGRWAVVALVPHLLVITLLCLVPTLLLFIYSGAGADAPGGFTAGLLATASDPFYQRVIGRTVGLALASAGLCVLLAYPVATTMVRLRGRWQTIAVALTILPLLTDLNVRALGQIVLYGRRGFVSQILQALGLSDGPVSILGTPTAVVLGMAQSYAPFAILALFAALKSQERVLLEAAQTLGAGRMRAFLSVTLPLSLPGAVAGAVIVFLLSLSSFVIPSILGSGQVLVLSVLIYQRALMVMDWAAASGLAMILLAIAVVVAWAMSRVSEAAERLHAPTVKTARAESLYQSVIGRLPDLSWHPLASGIIALTIAAYVLSPLLLLLVSAFNAGSVTEFPPSKLGVDSFVRLAQATGYIESFLVSMKVAVAAVLIAIPVGFLASLGTSRLSGRWRGPVQSYLLLPLMIPHVVLGIALLRYSNQLGTSATLAALIGAHLLVTLPYVARTVMGSLAAVRPSVEEAALTLGASRFQVIRHVVFPLVQPGIVVGALFAFVMSFTDIIINVFMASAQIFPLPVRIYSQLQDGYDLGLIAAMSVVFVLFAMVCVYLIDRLVNLKDFSIV